MMKTTATILLIILGLPGTLSGARAAEIDAADQQENACAGMSDGDYMGVEVCNECHEDTVTTMQMTLHGEALDNDCEICHGPGSMHLDEEGECIISMAGRFGESVEMLNEICLECHDDEPLQNWPDSIHKDNDVACADCHQIHGGRDVTDRQDQAGICYHCHMSPKRTETYQPYGHFTQRHEKMLCSSCHNPHGATSRFDRCRCTPWNEE